MSALLDGLWVELSLSPTTFKPREAIALCEDWVNALCNGAFPRLLDDKEKAAWLSATARDALIVGGGHNGLVCAAYLAAAGLKVTVLERRAVVGGAAVTEEFHPGFRNSVAAYTVSLLNPKIIRDLELARHGLRVVERGLSNFLPLEDGRYLKVGAGRTRAEVAKFSARDAQRLAAYAERLDAIADVHARGGARDSAERDRRAVGSRRCRSCCAVRGSAGVSPGST